MKYEILFVMMNPITGGKNYGRSNNTNCQAFAANNWGIMQLRNRWNGRITLMNRPIFKQKL